MAARADPQQGGSQTHNKKRAPEKDRLKNDKLPKIENRLALES